MGGILSKVHDYFYPPKRPVEVLLAQYEYRIALEDIENEPGLRHYQKKNFR
ncbi:MAG: hypothetical protein ACXAAH_15475 [Promethearchaeota archaeon]|jgi:hypothetical protein